MYGVGNDVTEVAAPVGWGLRRGVQESEMRLALLDWTAEAAVPTYCRPQIWKKPFAKRGHFALKSAKDAVFPI